MIRFQGKDLKKEEFAADYKDVDFSGFDFAVPYDMAQQERGQRHISMGMVPQRDRAGFSAFAKAGFWNAGVKAAGSDEYNIPLEFAGVAPVIRMIAAFEQAHNPHIKSCAVKVQLRKTRPVMGGTKDGDWHTDFTRHSDGREDGYFSLSAWPMVDHLYLVSDRNPTVMAKGGRGVAGVFNKAALEEGAEQLRPYEIALLNSYSWHRTAAQDWGRKRTLLLVTCRVPREFAPKGLGVGPAPR